jgi:hypothetical protein
VAVVVVVEVMGCACFRRGFQQPAALLPPTALRCCFRAANPSVLGEGDNAKDTCAGCDGPHIQAAVA